VGGGIQEGVKTRVFVSVSSAVWHCMSDFSPQDEMDRLQIEYKIKYIDAGQKEEAHRRQFCENRCVTRNIVLYSLPSQSMRSQLREYKKEE
jgi:hypothetical protein